MRCIEITSDSKSWKTSINGDDLSILKYFTQGGGYLDVGVYPEEKIERVRKIHFLDSNRIVEINYTKITKVNECVDLIESEHVVNF